MSKIIKTKLVMGDYFGNWYTTRLRFIKRSCHVTYFFGTFLGGAGTILISRDKFEGARSIHFNKVAPFFWQATWKLGSNVERQSTFITRDLQHLLRNNLEYTSHLTIWFRNETIEEYAEVLRRGYIQSAEEYEKSLQHDTYRKDFTELLPEPDILDAPSDAMFNQMKGSAP
jgi:hypothetical protein